MNGLPIVHEYTVTAAHMDREKLPPSNLNEDGESSSHCMELKRKNMPFQRGLIQCLRGEMPTSSDIIVIAWLQNPPGITKDHSKSQRSSWG